MVMIKKGIFTGHLSLALPRLDLASPAFALLVLALLALTPLAFALLPACPCPTCPCKLGLKALRAWKVFRPKGPSGMATLQAWRPCRLGGLALLPF